MTGIALHRLVLEDGGEPNRGSAERLDVVQAFHHALEIAAVEEALRRRIEAGREAIALKAAAIVLDVAVLEAVGQEEINDFVAGG
jgi:hypothetical protein